MKAERAVIRKSMVALTSAGVVALSAGLAAPAAFATESGAGVQTKVVSSGSNCREDEDGRWLINYGSFNTWYVLPTALTTCEEATSVVNASLYSQAQREAACSTRTVFYPGKFMVDGREWFCSSWSPLSGTTVTYGTADDALMRFTIQRDE